MKLLKINKSSFKKALSVLNRDYRVYLPIETNNKISFQPMNEFDNIDFGLRKSDHSIKEFVLPQTENLFFYKKDRQGKEKFDDTKKILIGVKPCDAKTFKILDFNFLSENPIDPYYKARRENTLIISISCNKFDENCFCDLIGDSPNKLNGADAIIYENGENLNILFANENLLKYFDQFKDSITDIKNEDDTFEKGTILSRNNTKLPIDKIRTNLKSLISNNDLWKKIESTCIGCGTCTFLCPACYCFDISDENWGSSGKRIRTYDSCMFSSYTLEASGHNPRKSGLERWRQRLLHKFNYYPTLYNEVGCSGCGRCIDKCPTKIDIREVITDAANKI